MLSHLCRAVLARHWITIKAITLKNVARHVKAITVTRYLNSGISFLYPSPLLKVKELQIM